MSSRKELIDALKEGCHCEPYGISQCVACDILAELRKGWEFHGTRFNAFAQLIHKENEEAGWWKDCGNWLDFECPPGYEENVPSGYSIADDKYILSTKIALIHSEVSEMLEGLRKGIPDDHLPERSMEEVEAADIFIRLLDYCGARGLDIDGAIAEKRAYNAQRADHSAAGRASAGGKKF